MRFHRQVIQYFIPFSVVGSTRDLYRIPQSVIVAQLLHVEVGDSQLGHSVVSSICDAFRRGWSWDSVSRKFDSIKLGSLDVEEVLLQLKEPIDAKRALGFFHWLATCKGFEHGIRTYSIIIHILVRARMFRDAQALLQSVIKRTANDPDTFCVVDSLLDTFEIAVSRSLVFDLLVRSYSRLRRLDVAFELCCYLETHGFSLSLISYNTLIHVIEKSEKHALVWKIYEHMIRRRIYPNQATIMSMISALCKEGNLYKYVDILDRIHGKRCSPSMIVSTCLLLRILEEGRIDEGMLLLRRMLQRNMILDTVSYSLIVYAKVKFGTLESALEVYEEMVRRGFHANSFIYTLFIGSHCTAGRIEEAVCLMQEMEKNDLKPYDETFNHLILGFSRVGKSHKSLEFCEKMINMGLIPSRSAFNEMLRNLCESRSVVHANAIFTLLLDNGFSPDENTYLYLIDKYGGEGEVDEVIKLFYEMKYRSLTPGLLAYESLITSLCQCGRVTEAEKYLMMMKDQKIAPSVRIYESLIASHSCKGDNAKVSQLYGEVSLEGSEASSDLPKGKEVLTLKREPNARRLDVLLRVLLIVQQLLLENRHGSKRDIYYMHPTVFTEQAVVDRAINDICILLQCSRHNLNVVSVAKGLVMGWLRFLEAGKKCNCITSPNNAFPVPVHVEEVKDVVSVAQYILVVEKESVFQRLANDRFCSANRCIVVTGRGYPDIPTRRFLRLLIETLRIPAYCLVDCDPYGFDILTTYCFGSMQMAYDAELLRVPEIQWLGAFPSDSQMYNVPQRCLLPLTTEDGRKIESILQRCYLQQVPEWRLELELMVQKGVKFEIEALSVHSLSFLSEEYIPSKIHGGNDAAR